MEYKHIPTNCTIKNNRVYNDHGRLAVVYGRNCLWYHDNTGQLECLTHPAIVDIALGRYDAVMHDEDLSVLADFDEQLYSVAKALFGNKFKVEVGNTLSISWAIGLHFIISRHPNIHTRSEMCLFGINSHILTIASDKLSVYTLPIYAEKSLEDFCKEIPPKKRVGDNNGDFFGG